MMSMKELRFQVTLPKNDQLYIQDKETYVKLNKRDLGNHIGSFIMQKIPELTKLIRRKEDSDLLETNFHVMSNEDLRKLIIYIRTIDTDYDSYNKMIDLLGITNKGDE